MYITLNALEARIVRIVIRSIHKGRLN